MRGRTLNHAFIILDEAQNTTPEQMKMFLTRIGFGSKAVVTGDTTQIDLPRGQKSGLIEAQHVLQKVRGIAMTHFTSADVVRHPLVARIVDAYEAHQNLTESRGHDGGYGRPPYVQSRPSDKATSTDGGADTSVASAAAEGPSVGEAGAGTKIVKAVRAVKRAKTASTARPSAETTAVASDAKPDRRRRR
jgi:hypothetical protein